MAKRNKVVSRRADNECRISPRGRRTSYLGAFTASTWPVYGEIRRSSSARRDATFFVYVVRYDLIPLSRRYIQHSIYLTLSFSLDILNNAAERRAGTRGPPVTMLNNIYDDERRINRRYIYICIYIFHRGQSAAELNFHMRIIHIHTCASSIYKPALATTYRVARSIVVCASLSRIRMIYMRRRRIFIRFYRHVYIYVCVCVCVCVIAIVCAVLKDSTRWFRLCVCMRACF